MLSAKQLGMTLLEVMLVLAIGAAFLVLGIRQYQAFKLGQDLQVVRGNVDTIFIGLLNYYRTNCGKGQPLDPLSAGSPITIGSWAINIPSMPLQGINLPVPSPVVDNSPPSYGYLVQINTAMNGSQPQGTTRQVYACTSYTVNPSPPYNRYCSGYSAVTPIAKANSVVVQIAQVAVKLVDPTKSQIYKNIVSADCVSDAGSGGAIIPCPPNGQPDPGTHYLVFDRWPSGGAISSSILWISNARLRQFNQQYTNDDFYALQTNDPTWNDPSSVTPGGQDSRYQDYLCTGN